jgi:NAD(P)-dependent dehydrogenase (short-subunit alcohol dehydrogenase family)
VKCDARKDIELENLVKVTIQEFGRIDILVNNAAALIP